jgi:hypothetical protein
MNSGGVSDPTPMNVRHYEYADTNRIDIEIQFTFPQYKPGEARDILNRFLHNFAVLMTTRFPVGDTSLQRFGDTQLSM